MFDDTLVSVANKLTEHCRNGTEAQGLEELYTADTVSVEAMQMPDTPSREIVGVDAIRGKHEWWDNSVELHSFDLEGPYFHGDDRFALIFDIDVTMKDSNERMKMKEVAIYTVANGKIAREEFYYAS